MLRHQNKFILLPLVIFLVSLFLRFYQIDIVPNGLYQDETAIGYNAYSIERIGRDEHGKVYPIYFKSFGDYKLPTYIYSVALSMKVFGVNEFSVRFPSALFGSISVLLLYIIVYKLSKNLNLATIASFFLAITPWHLHFSRGGFEVNLALFFVLMGVLTFVSAIEKKKYFILFFITSVCFLVAEYSYNVTRLLAPALLISLLVYFRKELRLIPQSNRWYLSPLLLIVFIPLLLTFLLNTGLSATTGNLILGPDNIAKNIELRSYFGSWPEPFVQIFFNRWALLLWQYLQNIIAIFSTKFLFLEGSTHGNHGIGNVGMFYIFQFPLVILGVIFIIRYKVKSLYIFFYWLLTTILLVALSKEVPHATRGFFLVIPITVFSAYGFTIFIDSLKKMRNTTLRFASVALSVGVIFYSILFYFSSYYFRFPVLYSDHWRSEDKLIAEYLRENENKYRKIIIDKDADLIYSSLLFYQKFDPSKLLSTQIREPDNIIGYHLIDRFGKYEYKNVDWDTFDERDALVIVGPKNAPINIEAKKIFFYPKRSVVTSANAQVGKIEVTEIVYIVYDSNKVIKNNE